MIDTIEIVPAEGRRARDPRDGKPIDGRTTVPLEPYWARRLADGDVVPAPQHQGAAQ